MQTEKSKRKRLLLPPNETPAAKRVREELPSNPLDELLDLCGGEIVPMVPNLQLFHFMLAYGHCGGGEGVCMDSIPRLMCVQSKIYDKQIACVTQTFSAAMSNNNQSKFTPNDWIDTFCKLMVDSDIGVPRMRKFAGTFREQLQLPRATRDPTSQLGTEMDAVTSLIQRCDGRTCHGITLLGLFGLQQKIIRCYCCVQSLCAVLR